MVRIAMFGASVLIRAFTIEYCYSLEESAADFTVPGCKHLVIVCSSVEEPTELCTLRRLAPKGSIESTW